MIPKRVKWPPPASVAPPLVPPNLQAMGSVAFSVEDRSELGAWLSEAGWPRERMDIVKLEGYLVGLIVWPVELSPGAWLPAIWGARGWKVAEKISAPDLFQKFNRLVIGYRQRLASTLNAAPPSFVPQLSHPDGADTLPNASTQWCVGFLSAVQQASLGFEWRSAEVAAAIHLIQSTAHAQIRSGSTNHQQISAELGAAVRAMVPAIANGDVSSSSKRPYRVRLQ